jgi:PAS domain S-box-containing protein
LELEIAQHQRATSALRDQSDLTRAITDTATTAIFQVDTDGCCAFLNPAAEAMTGYSLEEARGRHVHDLFHHSRPDGSAYPRGECALALAMAESGELHGHEDVFVRKNGEFFPIACNVRPIVKNGVVVGSVGEVRDITLEKRAAAALRESEALFRSMADSAPAMLWVTDPAGDCTYLSEQWYAFTGASPDQGPACGWFDSTHADDLGHAKQVFARAHERRVPFAWDSRVQRRDGEYRWSLTAGRPRFDPSGNFLGFVGCVFDVHDRKSYEQALRDSDRKKDEFLATLAHELRNPLAPIRNSLELLKLAPEDAALQEQARAVIERQLSQMVRLVDDLLDLSRITRNKLELRKEPMELRAAIESAIETSRPLIEQSGHTLEARFPETAIAVVGDLPRLAQVFANLLNNAAKYMERGGRIGLSVDLSDNQAVVSVTDAGIGIPEAMLPAIFDMFTQVDDSLERAQGGLGVGLTLVRRLVELHGGSVEARSAGLGRGSEFLVRLPVGVEAAAVSDAPAAAASAGAPVRQGGDAGAKRRVLVVDDNEDSAASLAMMLSLMGNETHTAHDGLAAVEAAQEFQPQVILLDIGLPKMNGYEVCAHIRAQPWGRGMILLALTGWGQEEDRRRSREAGFRHHLVKPVNPAELERVLAELPTAAA